MQTYCLPAEGQAHVGVPPRQAHEQGAGAGNGADDAGGEQAVRIVHGEAARQVADGFRDGLPFAGGGIDLDIFPVLHVDEGALGEEDVLDKRHMSCGEA